ncbi:Gfo/Idh/MocA family oxidoreductase [Stieleria sp. TO1_6]|uniref:Gfo/Idh/MocA family protein n=1 Tax=Stieleria tagensis TaxID=2956795 RepID=UPI00209B9B62|nr:Gfo/Idh/MocA family oxidoreductase [Stieleria tagensis]MCO8123144.1 Gfo/Idh/MocA family oxidoreductase [Stieleria tagensis]
MTKPWRIAGINFSHMHMGDLLRNVQDHPEAEIVGICDEQPGAMNAAVEALNLSTSQVFTDYQRCMETTQPDLVILCPPTGEHALWTERIAPFGAHLLVEKPFAASLADADRMIAAVEPTGKQLVINWPSRWDRSHYTASRLIADGVIGDVFEVHHYGGNRGPLYHGADKVEYQPTLEDKKQSWWYKLESGGGSLRDYLGYGVTMGTWFNGGQKPIEVTAVTTATPGVEVDEHSVTIARYANGLSKFETRWGTFTDPWVHQPQPKCGYVVRGSGGTISSYDYESTVRVQTQEHPEGFDQPVDQLPLGERNGIEYTLTRLREGLPIEGPLSPAIARIGQQIIETAIRSAEQKRTLPLIETSTD